MCGVRSFFLQEARGPQCSCLPFLAAWDGQIEGAGSGQTRPTPGPFTSLCFCERKTVCVMEATVT